jgi:hypothetical protein
VACPLPRIEGGRQELNEQLTVEQVSARGFARESSKGAHRQRSTLILTWTLDPATGKPVARWVIDGLGNIPGIALKSAA